MPSINTRQFSRKRIHPRFLFIAGDLVFPEKIVDDPLFTINTFLKKSKVAPRGSKQPCIVGGNGSIHRHGTDAGWTKFLRIGLRLQGVVGIDRDLLGAAAHLKRPQIDLPHKRKTMLDRSNPDEWD
ncbi:hypothetical protein DSO57_1033190 [Entomophthora muscae]|uniref:Uncharacterized protein n=2 Tax=Entomophthora muscae TaxID=34485 RepID=A0ACC2S2J2_9FUNG|nr:hypothetical protein DSO57_1033189 [Entomophthora muscae]KAJ9056422.1 hypothetical protein DSO57_1033190 [Entomophthora muscae]